MSDQSGNAADYFIARHLREGRGDRIAFTDPWRSLTYAELGAASARFAAGLKAAGIERERRIALVMLDTVDFPIAFWGEYAYTFEDSRAETLVISESLLKMVATVIDRARYLKSVVVVAAKADAAHPCAPLYYSLAPT